MVGGKVAAVGPDVFVVEPGTKLALAMALELSGRSSMMLHILLNSDLPQAPSAFAAAAGEVADVLRCQVLHEYLSPTDLCRLPASVMLVTSLFQTIGRAKSRTNHAQIKRTGEWELAKEHRQKPRRGERVPTAEEVIRGVLLCRIQAACSQTLHVDAQFMRRLVVAVFSRWSFLANQSCSRLRCPRCSILDHVVVFLCSEEGLPEHLHVSKPR
jgi:hypothetical protein